MPKEVFREGKMAILVAREVKIGKGVSGLSVFDWGPLRKTVLDAIEQGQIGRPVSLRLTVHGPGNESEIQGLKDEVLDLANTWFGRPCESEYSVGGNGGASVIALKWSGGQSAILSLSAGPGRKGGNLVLLGSNGAIYHDIGPVPADSLLVAPRGGD